MEDDFWVFWGVNMAWAASDAHVAPALRFQDDVWNLVIIRGSPSRLSLISFLLALETGDHVNNSCVEDLEEPI